MPLPRLADTPFTVAIEGKVKPLTLSFLGNNPIAPVCLKVDLHDSKETFLYSSNYIPFVYARMAAVPFTIAINGEEQPAILTLVKASEMLGGGIRLHAAYNQKGDDVFFYTSPHFHYVFTLLAHMRDEAQGERPFPFPGSYRQRWNRLIAEIEGWDWS